MTTTSTKRVAATQRGTAALPTRFEPQLATLAARPPEGDEWLHEIKFDGYRIGCRIDGDDIRLISRNGKDWTSSFPEVRAAAARLPVSRALLDGEVAMLLPNGRTSFQALQKAFKGGGREHLVYFVFDLLHLDGEDIAPLPLEERKRRVQRLLQSQEPNGVLRYAEHVVGHGPAFFAHACDLHLEGAVSKRRDLPYHPGRSRDWLKAKCLQRQEFVIGGFTDPEGSRAGIGALLAGVYDDAGALIFAGKVGTGFTQKSAQQLRDQLASLEQAQCPFATRPAGPLGRRAHWVAPLLVAEVRFTEWTADGKIRHPSFLGLRADKPPQEIRCEGAEPSPPRHSKDGATVAGVPLTHPERVLYPDLGLTKLELAQYYEAIAEWMLPHVSGRPLTLVRCPSGLGTSCFYMKHSHVWAPAALRRIRIPEKRKTGEYLVADSAAALVALAQMDILEIHTWNATQAHIEQPDRIVLDLDPGPEVQWSEVIRAAQLLRDALAALGLQSFVKTTGGVGLHVVVPLLPAADWAACLAFSRAVAAAIVRHAPGTYTTAFAKAGRERKILIDYLRNNRTNTSVAAFSTRANPKASVSVPLAWDELTPTVRSDHYTVRTVRSRLARLRRDPWQAYWSAQQRLTPEIIDALARL